MKRVMDRAEAARHLEKRLGLWLAGSLLVLVGVWGWTAWRIIDQSGEIAANAAVIKDQQERIDGQRHEIEEGKQEVARWTQAGESARASFLEAADMLRLPWSTLVQSPADTCECRPESWYSPSRLSTSCEAPLRKGGTEVVCGSMSGLTLRWTLPPEGSTYPDCACFAQPIPPLSAPTPDGTPSQRATPATPRPVQPTAPQRGAEVAPPPPARPKVELHYWEDLGFVPASALPGRGFEVTPLPGERPPRSLVSYCMGAPQEDLATLEDLLPGVAQAPRTDGCEAPYRTYRVELTSPVAANLKIETCWEYSSDYDDRLIRRNTEETCEFNLLIDLAGKDKPVVCPTAPELPLGPVTGWTCLLPVESVSDIVRVRACEEDDGDITDCKEERPEDKGEGDEIMDCREGEGGAGMWVCEGRNDKNTAVIRRFSFRVTP